MADTEAIQSGDIIGGMGLKGFFNAGTVGTTFLWIFVIIIGMTLIAGLIVWLVLRKSYNQKIWVFGKVGGVPMLKYVDKAKYVAFGMVGDKLMQIKKIKKFVPPPTIQMGKNLWWFWERSDGELINIGLEDIDLKMMRVGAYFTDTDMRMQRLGIEKNLRDRLEQKGFFAKYGTVIAGVIFIIMVTVALVVLFSKLKDTAQSIDTMAGNVGKLASAIEEYYEVRIGGEAPSDNPDGSGGLVPALIPLILFKFGRRKWQVQS